MSGDLFIHRQQDEIVMDFPAYKLNEVPVTEQMAKAMGAKPVKAYIDRDLLFVYEDEKIIREMKPDFDEVLLLDGDGVGVTAQGKEYDCVSRFFTPKDKINEDPVTGSVHCMIAPYWAERLGKNDIHAYQASERGGSLECKVQGARVVISGKAVLYSIGELFVS